MKRKSFFGCLSVIAIVVLYGFVCWRLGSSNDKSDLKHELDLARKVGIPTTWQEFAATIKSAAPSENAARFYRQLAQHPKDSADWTKLQSDVLLRPSLEHLAAAKADLALQKDVLAKVDKAAAMPRCWFDRDWSKGSAVLMPELAYMKMGAKLVCLRGSVAAAEGKAEDAIRNAEEVFRIAKHSGEEGTMLSFLVSDAIRSIGIHYLALWSYAFRTEAIYLQALQKAVDGWPSPNLQQMHLSDLLEIRDFMTLSTTTKGRAELGLKEEDVPITEKIIPLFTSRFKADKKIAKGMRQIWQAYGEPPSKRIAKVDAVWADLMPALAAYPTGGQIYLSLTSGEESDH